MTDSNIQPPDPTNDQTVNINNSNSYDPTTAGAIPGTDVTFTTPAGLYPEGTDPNQDVVITTGTAADTFTVDPNIDYAGAVDFQVDTMNHGGPIDDPRIDHVLEHLHNLEAKIDQLICDCNHHKEPPVYQGHVVLHANEPSA